jgi:outer membrane lipoprotein carrier protein
MKIKQLLAAVVVAAAPGLAFGADAAVQLRDFVAKVASASGQFSQQTIIRQGSGKPAQTGEFAFQRPGKFKWAIQKPYEQLIVSDGKVVYQYDPDLLQVTERSVDQSVGASPAAILFGSGSLDDAFKVAALPDADGLQWLRATPRTASAGFAHVDIGFQNNIPHRLDVLDSFGQTTRIELSQMVLNPTLADDAFRVVAPKGVDVVKMP